MLHPFNSSLRFPSVSPIHDTSPSAIPELHQSSSDSPYFDSRLFIDLVRPSPAFAFASSTKIHLIAAWPSRDTSKNEGWSTKPFLRHATHATTCAPVVSCHFVRHRKPLRTQNWCSSIDCASQHILVHLLRRALHGLGMRCAEPYHPRITLHLHCLTPVRQPRALRSRRFFS